MRHYLRIISVLLSVFAMTLVSFDLSFATENNEEISVLEFSGKVASLDSEKLMLVIESLKEDETQESQRETFYIDGNTSIEKDYLEANLDDLTVGDRVEIEYRVDSNGQNIAVSVSAFKENQN